MNARILSLCAAALLALWAGLCPAQPGASAAPGAPAAPAAPNLFKDQKMRLVVRCDDAGMCHAANQAVKRVLEQGVVSAVSVMVVTPWLDEAVEILKEHPEVSIGVHTCLNCEWTPYRWGPVLPAKEVPSLVDEWGHFYGSRQEMLARNPNPDEVEKELRAQVDLALRKGLKISYIDHHMGAAVCTPELRERFVRVAKDYNLAISRWFGEQAGPVWYRIEPERKADFLVEGLRKLDKPGLYILVCHPGLDVPEMSVLKDLNTTLGLTQMAVHRQAETDALCDPRVRAAMNERGIELVGYDLLAKRFLGQMTPPAE